MKPLILYDGERGIALKPKQGNHSSFQVDLGYTKLHHIPVVTPVSFYIFEGFLGDSPYSIKQIKAPYLFEWEQEIAQHTIQGNRASSLGEGEVSWVFSSCRRNLWYILELWRG